MPLRILLVLSFAIAAVPATHAQDPAPATPGAVLTPGDTVREFRLSDGSRLIGRVVAATPERVTIETGAGVRVEVDRAQIVSVRSVRRSTTGELLNDDPNTTRLFFGPTGRSLQAGTGYFGVFELFFPYLALGLSDRLVVAGGTVIFPAVIGRVWYLAPKLQVVNGERAKLSVGAAGLAAFGVNSADGFGIAYGVGTFGSADNALTVGVGIPFAGDELAERPLGMLGGELRISPRSKLLTESYIFTSRDYDCTGPTFQDCGVRLAVNGIAVLGVRFIGERLSADAGPGFGFGPEGGSCCIPVVNFVYNFGESRPAPRAVPAASPLRIHRP